MIFCTNILKHAMAVYLYAKLTMGDDFPVLLLTGTKNKVLLAIGPSVNGPDRNQKLDSKIWKYHKLVVYTSVVLAGISYDEEQDFDRAYAIFGLFILD